MKTYIETGIVIITAFMVSCNNTSSKKQINAVSSDDAAKEVKIEQVFADSTYQLTGVAAAENSRLFVNYPYWLEKHKYSVVEVIKGRPVPYPDAEWNSFKKGEDGQNKFVCVQAVVADDKGFLWVVDAAGIGLGKVYNKSNKIVKINLKTNQIEHIYRFPENVAGENVYLNDIRIDTVNGFAYITNSNTGGIIILNTKTGSSRFVLGDSPAVKSDPDYHFSPLGKELLKGDGTPLKVNSDGIALTPDNKWLYFKALTDDNLYRIKTEMLREFDISDEILNKNVENLGKFTTTDGMIFDKKGNLYFGDLEKNSIVKITPDLKMQTIVQNDNELIWPDSYSISEDGYLFVSVSQIQNSPWFHQGKELFKKPFKVVKIKID
ncbi:L-dopachrome tautomerase-related protein [Flavobacterium anhuiense]|uniref:L-dopachrome tautomerase-related protein n=1 Tax=Flavobacterium anhuiense TaxID=459526 RepID=UPI003D96D157